MLNRSRSGFGSEFCSFYLEVECQVSISKKIRVEASHANAHPRAVAFSSYIWFTYDIMSLYCYKLRRVVVIMLSYQPPLLGSIRGWVLNDELGKKCTKLSFILLQNFALKLGLGQRCQPEGIAIRSSSFLAYESDVPFRLSVAPCLSFARPVPR